MEYGFARKVVASAFTATFALLSVEARSMLYYYDFDRTEGDHLVYTGVNKGTGTLEPTFKWGHTDHVKATSPGAFGSPGALHMSSASSLWLGDGSNSLGCGTQRGFTLSFWLKIASTHPVWTDFFGFRVNGIDYRCEYTTGNNGNFTMYYNVTSSAANPLSRLDGAGTIITEATAGEWKHVAYVCTPNDTNGTGNCWLYMDGRKLATVKLYRAGDLQQVHLGSWVRQLNGGDRYSSANNTTIDEFALFDYPATDEQVKWLVQHKPGQPANGPGRAMPIAYLFDEGGDSTGGVLSNNAGTGSDVEYRWVNTYFGWSRTSTALGSAKCFHLNNNATYRVDGASPTEGLGATLGSGMSISFWVKAPQKINPLWSDFMSFRLGDRYERFEWDVSNPVGFHIYGDAGGNADPRAVTLKADTWQHVCMVWNAANSRFEFYLDGEKHGHYVQLNSASDSEALKTFIVGTQVFNNGGSTRASGGRTGTYVDEVAVFNYSLSPEQICWLTNNVPCLPPLDATNLVRTVSANGAWAGGLASWGVKDTTRTTIYPALEDAEAEVAVTLADGVTLDNDTFVTPKHLILAAKGSSGTAVLTAAEGSLFAPRALKIGNGLQLTVPLYAVNVEGALTLGTSSKIVFDVSNFNDDGTTNALAVGSFVLPAGETDADILSHFDVNDNRFTLSLSADGKKILVAADTIPVTATWTGAGDGTSLNSAANWDCRNSSGASIADALPCNVTRVVISSGTASLNAPVGTVIPWECLRIEAGTATLAADRDWRGFGAVTIPEGVTVTLGGNNLSLPGRLDGWGKITDTAATGGALNIDVAAGATNENVSVTLAGTLRLVKIGGGTFVAKRENQSYTGGTEVSTGTLALGSNWYPLGAKNATVKVCEGATYDMNGFVGTYACIYRYDLAGTFRNWTGKRDNGWGAGYKCFGSPLTLSGDATLTGGGFYFANPDGDLSIAMNGHTLTFVTDDLGSTANYIGLGSLKVSDPGKMEFRYGLYEWLAATTPTNVDMEVVSPAYFKLGNATDGISIKGLVYGGTKWEKNSSKATRLNVYGTYLAGPMRPPMVMMDESTIDFSEASLNLTNVYVSTTASVVSCTTPGELLFEDGATIHMKFGDRVVSDKEPVVRWTAKPANIDGVKFKCVDSVRRYFFDKKDDGLYAVTRGFCVLVR